MSRPSVPGRRAVLVLGAAGAFLPTLALAAGPTLLNVSYDVSREFYKDYNAVFAAYWKKTAGEDLVLNQSHGGSSRQARSVVEGLEADVITMNQANDIELDEHVAGPQRSGAGDQQSRGDSDERCHADGLQVRSRLGLGGAGSGLNSDADFAGGLLQQSVGRAGEQPERAPEDAEYREPGRGQVACGQVEDRVAAERAEHRRDADPCHTAGIHSAGSSTV